MSPRRTRAATAEQSAVSTRSKVQRINNVNQDAAQSAQKIRQSQKKSGKNNLEADAKQSAKKKSPDAEVTVKKSARKTTSRRKLNLDTKVETENVDESIKVLKDRHCDDVITVKLIKHDFLQNVSTDLEKIPNEKLQRKTSKKISPVIVTPKSTPPKLSLTPHRSKKTPKKSPISLGSPKTHSIAIPKLLKSPRKLSLATGEDSEKNFEKLDNNSHAKKSRKKKSLSSSSMSDKSLSSPTEKKERKKSNLKLTTRTFSKSPKIVLKNPKSKKSKSRKLKLLSPSQLRKSPSKTSTSPDTMLNLNDGSSIRIKKSLPKEKESIKQRLLNSKLTKTLTASQIKDVLAEPIVLLEKLSPESLKQKNPMVASKTQSDISININSPLIKTGSNSKVLIPMKKASASVSTKRNSSPRLKNSSIEKSQISNTIKISPRTKYNTSTQEKDGLSVPLMSSTPQVGKMALTDTSSAFSTSIASVSDLSFNTRLRHRNTQLSNIMDKNTDIENVSKPSLLDEKVDDTTQSFFLDVMKRDATYDKDDTIEKKPENDKDNTYELEQPQTLSLRQMIKKRTSTDANLSSRNSAKKAKVHFLDVTSSKSSVQKSLNKLNGSPSNISHNINVQNRSNIINLAHKSKKIETPKPTQNSLIPSFKRLSPRIHADISRIPLSRVQVTPKTFASVEKKSEKKSSMKKKVPNFGKIHEQIFAKSESFVDAKKRLAARHLAFNKAVSKANVKTEEKKPLPTDTKDGIHNRFGFKLKKSEATQIILKKQAVFSRQKQQDKTRLRLKGVRTNRRFELQMKIRNLNL